jgi:hypothetical protein
MKIVILFILASALCFARVRVIVVGDSHMAGYGQSQSIPAQLPPDKYEVFNLAVSGSKFCSYFVGSMENQVDSLYTTWTEANVIVLEGGGNDVVLDPNVSPQDVYACQRSWALRRKQHGFKIVLYGMYSRGQAGAAPASHTADQVHDALNSLYAAGWRDFADEYVNVSGDMNVGPDGAFQGSTFISDGVHIGDSYTPKLAAMLRQEIDAVVASTQTVQQSGGYYAGPQFGVQNFNPYDFSGVAYYGDQQWYITGVGNSQSIFPGQWVIFDYTRGLRRLAVDSSGIVSIDSLKASTGLSPVCSDQNGALVRCN